MPPDQGHYTNAFQKIAGLSQSDKCRFCWVETESTSHLLSGCKKLMAEQLYTEIHDSICRVIHWHICKHFNIPVPSTALHPVTAQPNSELQSSTQPSSSTALHCRTPTTNSSAPCDGPAPLRTTELHSTLQLDCTASRRFSTPFYRVVGGV